MNKYSHLENRRNPHYGGVEGLSDPECYKPKAEGGQSQSPLWRG